MAVSPKAALRRRLLAARSAVPAARHAADADALRAHLAALPVAGSTVCAYVPAGAEPGTPAMLAALRRRGLRVLIPAVAAGDPAPLRWGDYHAETLAAGRFGLAEPPPPWLPPRALGRAALVLVPALAVDAAGVRLGRGGGFYDRSLPLADPRAPRVAVVRDDELLAALPADPHDVAMTHALTPARGLVALTGHGAGITPSD
ncbi:5-formyltetrahydrofolate cyclo-ligase [Mycolicibacillus parakoreensis]|uniref:5-formyltetrahydrofolate cyclo-ligase n=1 Tax=Mycolicibacillus parakoreensis TaxID=1069221 RepID=A0ABY3U407_9MYCO|nr:5-formyltetrahydrofolate cyclo-ligase [Mycolicibacillus parakoreensis]MCV7315196.1 5-formyltetrahydrofolate cyclo-ligase [Mycolicibacillus parakoreensis]ULN53466.1 5-formyltetrahydrofolate cyclo-ligase [Mycolicibacillus parakoreensis]HLR98964.1 5-formyltetrahydrofolate cyclo-ligase [Mycolicibacillus parakoreensis]